MEVRRGQGHGNDPSRRPADPDASVDGRRRARRRQLWPTGILLLGVSLSLLGVIALIGLTVSRRSIGAAPRPLRHSLAGPTPSASPSPSTSHRPATASGKARTATSTAGPTPASRVPRTGPGRFTMARTAARPRGRRGRLLTYDVRVERNLSFDPDDTARFIHHVLNDRRSWGRSGRWRLQLVGPGRPADIHAYVATARTTDRLCAPLRTQGKVSCFNDHRVVLNADRWAYGARSYGDRLIDYRRNVVNHEFGHALGFGHLTCPGPGRRAPIMMQQTKGLHGCRANPWPFPKA